MKNPLASLDAILADWASPRTRRLIHALIALAMLVISALLAANGDWKVAALSLIGTLYAAINKANTPALSRVDEDSDDDGETYEEAGGRPFPGGEDVSLYHTQDPGTALS